MSGEHPFTFFTHVFHLDHHYLHLFTAIFVVGLVSIKVFAVYPKLRNVASNIVPPPSFGLKNVLELFVQFIVGLCDEVMGKHGRKYVPFVGTIFLFIFSLNLIGMIPGFLPPTENWVTGAATACMVLIAFNYFGFKEHGFSYLKHFIAPISLGPMGSVVKFVAIMIPLILLHALIGTIETISMMVRPVSLTIRLFANIVADHTVLGVFSGLVPYVVPIPFMLFGLFVAFMQAFIFTMLTIVYVSGATAHDH